MKAVLLSIQPKWCELIASGKKTVEVRKNKPKLETPFRCYIYETQGGTETPWIDEGGHEIFKGRGQVIGEFVCDKIYDIKPHYDIPIFCNQYEYGWKIGEAEDCLSFEELDFYLGGKCGYGWHVSDLKIYDKPKELNEFGSLVKTIDWERGTVNLFKGNKFYKPMKRPPVSWCYVEEINDNTLQ